MESSDVTSGRFSPVKGLRTSLTSANSSDGGTLTIMRYSSSSPTKIGNSGLGTSTSPAAYQPIGNSHSSYQPISKGHSSYQPTRDGLRSTLSPAVKTSVNGYDTGNTVSSPYYKTMNSRSGVGVAMETRSVPSSPFRVADESTTAFKPYNYADTDTKHNLSSTFNGEATAKSFVLSSPLTVSPRTRTTSAMHYNQEAQYSGADLYNGNTSSKTNEKKAKELENVLDESESRRQLLVEKLDDARKTIQLQAQRLSQLEGKEAESISKLEEMKSREQEYKRRILQTEGQRENWEKMIVENNVIRSHLQDKVDRLEADVRTMTASNNLLQVDTKRRQEFVEQTKTALHQYEMENDRLDSQKNHLTLELAATKDALEMARNRNESLDMQLQAATSELDTLRSNYKRLSAEHKDYKDRLKDSNSDNEDLRERITKLMTSLDSSNEDRDRLQSQLQSLQDLEGELQTTLTATANEKERHFRDKLELHQKLQALALQLDSLRKEKEVAEQQVADMAQDVERARQRADIEHERNSGQGKELDAAKKVAENLSVELTNARGRIDQLTETNRSLEQSKKLALQQHELYEQEIRGLQDQLENSRQAMAAIMKSQEQAKSATDDHAHKLKDEIRTLKADRSLLEQKVLEMEARLRVAEQSVKERAELQLTEVSTWKANVDRLTSSLARKDAQLQEVTGRLEQLQSEHERGDAYVKSISDSQQNMYEELTDAKDENQRLKDENRRLLQERAENQQMIQLLEMQKQILSKMATSRGSDADQSEATENEMIGQLRGQIQRLQKERDQLLQDKNSRPDSVDGRGSNSPYFRPVPAENRYQVERLTELEQDNIKLRMRLEDSVPKADVKKMQQENKVLQDDYRRLKDAHEELEKRHHEILSNRSRRQRSDDTDGGSTASESLRREMAAMAEQMRLVQSQVEVAETSKKRADDSVHKLEKQVEDLQEELFRNSQSKVAQIVSMQKTINDLQSQLDARGGGRRGSVCSSTDEMMSDVPGGRYDEMMKLREIIRVKNEEIAKLKSNRELTSQTSMTDGVATDQNGGNVDTELRRQIDRLKRELSSKERQVETLEEQLQVATMVEIKKLKRDAGKVELLKAENRRLQSELGQKNRKSSHAGAGDAGDDEDDDDTETETNPARLKQLPDSSTQLKSGNETEDSWDDVDVKLAEQLAHTGIHSSPPRTRKSQELSATTQSKSNGSAHAPAAASPNGDLTSQSGRGSRKSDASGSSVRVKPTVLPELKASSGSPTVHHFTSTAM